MIDTYGEWNEEVKQFLTEQCVKDGVEPTERNLIELLSNTDVIDAEIYGEHRWYLDEQLVVKLNNRLIGFMWAKNTGDDSLDDLGWSFDLGSVDFYKAIQVTTTKYVPEK